MLLFPARGQTQVPQAEPSRRVEPRWGSRLAEAARAGAVLELGNSHARRDAATNAANAQCRLGWRISSPQFCWRLTLQNFPPTCFVCGGAPLRVRQARHECDFLHHAAQHLARADVPEPVAEGLRIGRMVALQKPGASGLWSWGSWGMFSAAYQLHNFSTAKTSWRPKNSEHTGREGSLGLAGQSSTGSV